ncbi:MULTISPECIES: thioredoxin family protein [unclassified Duganella]|uniref:thioredoxin family protein n=1 Tax=unclassified Duganella TaxID=2636909 RepID=UPI000E34BBD4|nr:MULTISPECIES: thioredoxin family protein [unclassified Duganella]RFP11986.1 thioredoxin [Duganella sp. BJB475]RFP30003.1 thioredoxin [Duganella sp. BJB476]
MEKIYLPTAPDRATVDALAGATLLEFGANWCGHCIAAQAPLAQAYTGHEGVRHYKVEDGPGRALGRSYRVKLWPTLIFLRDGQEVARLVRPLKADEISVAFAQIDT